MDITTHGIDEAALRRLIPLFYDRVRRDPELGPIFDGVVHDWPAHLATLTDFWSSVMLTTAHCTTRYKGNPMRAHLALRETITPELFDRWLALWAATTDEHMPAAAAAALQAKAARIAESLKLALFFRLDPAPRQATA